ncbi:MAG TPA: hypothetical protein VFQ62_20185 [Methylomirabilota bacterium]|nr:hypothetical protein [Methylomirabilota bacterium]
MSAAQAELDQAQEIGEELGMRPARGALPAARLAAAPIGDGGRQPARHRPPARDTFASMSEAQGDCASLGVQDDSVGIDGRHRDSAVDGVADAQHLLAQAARVLQHRESC